MVGLPLAFLGLWLAQIPLFSLFSFHYALGLQYLFFLLLGAITATTNKHGPESMWCRQPSWRCCVSSFSNYRSWQPWGVFQATQTWDSLFPPSITAVEAAQQYNSGGRHGRRHILLPCTKQTGQQLLLSMLLSRIIESHLGTRRDIKQQRACTGLYTMAAFENQWRHSME